ncbi:hypothetical protein L2X99_15055 [Microbacterium sp. KUDC0406]|uniref:hypothetical protein n=1 Tax=Microbacterium sp. KUDC0406 TaxID=2909588 RepID=UPI001F39FF1C|nr:hypothetical protein [Microbacterium sp. KUDC0406]UJP09702.1 hypothetical protein L2X99_15055 [Microbacterium sp. KUDC0406]
MNAGRAIGESRCIHGLVVSTSQANQTVASSPPDAATAARPRPARSPVTAASTVFIGSTSVIARSYVSRYPSGARTACRYTAPDRAGPGGPSTLSRPGHQTVHPRTSLSTPHTRAGSPETRYVLTKW